MPNRPVHRLLAGASYNRTRAGSLAGPAATTIAEATSFHYAGTLPYGYANGIVPHQATTLAQCAADLAAMSASTMRRAMAAAENAQSV